MKTKWRRVGIGVAVCIPVAIFFAAREAASWRPRHLAGLPYQKTIAISPDEKLVAAADNLLTVRELGTGTEIYHSAPISWQGKAQPGVVEELAFSPDSRQIAVCWTQSAESGLTQKTGIRLVKLGEGVRDLNVPRSSADFDSPTQLRFSPDGQTLWLASTDNFRAWDLKSGRLIRQWRQTDLGRSASIPYFGELSPDCHTFFHSGEGGFSIWDTRTGKLLNRYKLEGLADGDLELSPDTSLLVHDDPHKEVRWVVEPRTGKRLWQRFDGPQLLNGKLAYSLIGAKKIDMRDSRSGKYLFSVAQVPNLKAIFPSSQESQIYVLDNDGQLWRQRIR